MKVPLDSLKAALSPYHIYSSIPDEKEISKHKGEMSVGPEKSSARVYKENMKQEILTDKLEHSSNPNNFFHRYIKCNIIGDGQTKKSK